MSDLVSLITVNYNQTEVTCALLESIRRQDWRAVEVIVVDNGSRDNAAAVLAARYPEVRFVRSERNLGFAGGNRLGVAAATGDFLFFVNNDAELTPGCIDRLLALFKDVPRLGMVSPLICYFPEKKQATDVIQYAGMTRVHPLTARNRTIGQGETDRGQFAAPQPTAYAHGAAMLVPRAALEQAGPMDDDFFLYYEELDWAERIRRAGYEIWVEPRARVYHKESLTVQKLGALKTYYLNRNRVWFMRRNFRGPGLAVFYLFLALVAVPKNALAFALRSEWANFQAFWQGIIWNFGWKNNRWERGQKDPETPPAAPLRLENQPLT